MATDKSGDGLGAPAIGAFAITPDDDTDLTIVPRALYVGGAGDIVVNMFRDGTAITFVGVTAGTVLPIRVLRVKSTSTTATSILGLY